MSIVQPGGLWVVLRSIKIGLLNAQKKKVVYSIPLSCGRQYIWQTGRCLKDRMREHWYNVNRVVSGHLGVDCCDCGCVAE